MNAATRQRKPRRMGRYKHRYRSLHALHLDIAMVLSLLLGWLLLPSFKTADYDAAAAPLKIRMENTAPDNGDSPDSLVFSPALFAFGGGEPPLPADFWENPQASSASIPIPPTPPLYFQDDAPAEPAVRPSPGASIVGAVKMPPAPTPHAIPAGSPRATPGRRAYIFASGGLKPDTHLAPKELDAAPGTSVEVFIAFDADGNADSAVLGPNQLTPASAAALERSAMRLKGTPGSSAYIVISLPEL